ncbi:MAG TPA: hemolysin III family protein [Pseudonocardiaceae bacterium]
MSAPSAGQPASPLPGLPPKPRLRGWIHFWSFPVAVVAGAVLISLSWITASGRVAAATAVYSVTVCALFGVSALYHRRNWANMAAYTWMRRLDHSMIFLFIAGTYTPFALLAMEPETGTRVLAVVWGGALAGVTLKMAWPSAPRWLGVPIYVALGWVAVFVLPELLHNAGPVVLGLLLAGGILYTLGGVFYALRWPNPWPRVFGFHEFFHTATVLAALCHHVAVWLVLYR